MSKIREHQGLSSHEIKKRAGVFNFIFSYENESGCSGIARFMVQLWIFRLSVLPWPMPWIIVRNISYILPLSFLWVILIFFNEFLWLKEGFLDDWEKV